MNNFNLFESYIFDKLSQSERKTFENNLESNDTFRDDFENHKRVQEAMDVLVDDDVQKVIHDLDNKGHDKVTSINMKDEVKSIIPMRWIGVAVVFLFLVTIGYLMKNKILPPSALMALSSGVEMYMEEGSRGDGTSIDIYNDYGKYINESIESENWEQAANKLMELMAVTKGTSTYDQAEWNLASIYAEYDTQKSISILERILNDDKHDYHDVDKVKKLLERIQ